MLQSRFALGVVTVSFALMSAAAACGEDQAAAPPTPVVPNRATRIGQAGGTVTSGAVSLAVPPGALPTDTAITITATDAPAPAGVTPYSKVARFEPSGLVFTAPVEVAFDLPSDALEPTVYWTRQGSETEFEAIGGRVSGGKFVAQVTHFSLGFLGRRAVLGADGAARDAASDAPPPQPCDACGGGGTCAVGLTFCGSACVNLATDPKNCGQCGFACTAGETCAARVCIAPAG
jgi:hypothetical protein